MQNLKTPENSDSTFQIAQGVKWSVETQGLLLIDREGVNHWLPYPQAALWDFISRCRSLDKMKSMLSSIASLDSRACEDFMLESIGEWVKLGLLDKCEK